MRTANKYVGSSQLLCNKIYRRMKKLEIIGISRRWFQFENKHFVECNCWIIWASSRSVAKIRCTAFGSQEMVQALEPYARGSTNRRNVVRTRKYAENACSICRSIRGRDNWSRTLVIVVKDRSIPRTPSTLPLLITFSGSIFSCSIFIEVLTGPFSWHHHAFLLSVSALGLPHPRQECADLWAC
jgi:hypothetical protein